MNPVDGLPVGTVTFLFTDIEGSTQLLKQLGGELYSVALADHQRILRQAFSENGGHEIDTQGDSFFVAFRRAKDAVAAAVECQRRLAKHDWPDDTLLRVRMGIHTGEPAATGERYVGLGVHRAARICAAGHGGQVLLSQTARELLRDDPIPDVSLRDLGEHQLKDIDEPEHLYQLVAPGLQGDFPVLKTAAPAPFEGREGELAEAAAEQMAKSWRRPGRRVLIGATFAAAVVGVALGVALTLGGGSSVGAAVGANSVGVIDAGSGKVVSRDTRGSLAGRRSPSGRMPSGSRTRTTTPSPASTRRRTRAADDPGRWRGRRAWQSVAPRSGSRTASTGPSRGSTRRSTRTWQTIWSATARAGSPTARAWSGSRTPSTGRSPASTRTGRGAEDISCRRRAHPGSPSGSAACGWSLRPPGALVEIDPRSGQVVQTIAVGVDPSAVAIGAGAVWVANRADGTVSKIDPGSASVAGPDSASAPDRAVSRRTPGRYG